MRLNTGLACYPFCALLFLPTPAVPDTRDDLLILRAGFEGSDPLRDWSPVPSGVSVTPAATGSPALIVERPAKDGSGIVMVRQKLQIERVRGRRVRCEARGRAEAVAAPPHEWKGVKIMLHIVAPSGDRWEQRNGLWGTFDWKPVRFRTAAPADATEVWLHLGLEATTGRAWFDDVTVRIATGVMRHNEPESDGKIRLRYHP